MFPNAERMVSMKVSTLLQVIWELRKAGVTDSDSILMKYKKKMRALYRLNAILACYSNEQEEWINPYDEIDRENCQAFIL